MPALWRISPVPYDPGMHELSLATDILRIVEAAAARERFARVRLLRLEVGKLAGVEVSALRFALEAIGPGSCLAQARIEIEEPDAQALCPACGETSCIDSRLDPCPACGAFGLQVRGGTQLRVVELLVDDAPFDGAQMTAPAAGQAPSGQP